MRISIILLAVFMTGCASIISDDKQVMTIESDPQGADCELVNQEGTFIAKDTPATVTLNTTCKPMTVTCTKEGYQKAQINIDYSHKGSAWGNILAGGPIGYIVDRQTGAGCDYPQRILVPLTER